MRTAQLGMPANLTPGYDLEHRGLWPDEGRRPVLAAQHHRKL
jgi:hypothetical protein